jgi:predicted RNA-binding protein
MATTHVFIVDTTTFKIHLEYLFAGTGAGDKVVDFNNINDTALKYATENNLVGMISDSQRIRHGDYVIFYLQQNAGKGILEGKFYGIFRAATSLSFLDNNDEQQFLKAELEKSLTFRIQIEPYQVYAQGVTEWAALDEIRHIQSPHQMLWSLIYRKLKGNRGNTMLTIYESERLFKLIRDKNNRIMLNAHSFSYNCENQEIIANQTMNEYAGRREPINIFPRLEKKYNNNLAFESHLQAYIVQNIGRGINNSLDECLLENMELEWLGNEVSCGVGMQRIDIAISLINEDTKIIGAVELKAVPASNNNVFQLQRYVDWLEQYYIPNRVSDIKPILVTKKIQDKNQPYYSEILEGFRGFNTRNQNCIPLKFVEYEILNHQLVFSVVEY